MQSTAAMGDAMKGAARAMYMMNRTMNIPQLQKIMMRFEREGEMMELKQEVMEDTIDGVMEQEGDEEAQDEVLNQVLDEIGINLSADLGDAPKQGVKQQQAAPQRAQVGAAAGGGGPAAGGGSSIDDDLASRLANLRKGSDDE